MKTPNTCPICSKEMTNLYCTDAVHFFQGDGTYCRFNEGEHSFVIEQDKTTHIKIFKNESNMLSSLETEFRVFNYRLKKMNKEFILNKIRTLMMFQ